MYVYTVVKPNIDILTAQTHFIYKYIPAFISLCGGGGARWTIQFYTCVSNVLKVYAQRVHRFSFSLKGYRYKLEICCVVSFYGGNKNVFIDL